MIITDTNNPYRYLGQGYSHSIYHDLTDDGVPDDYRVTGARLKLQFSDGYYYGDWAYDFAHIGAAGVSKTFEVDGTHYWGFDVRWVGVGGAGIDSLNQNGKLKVTVTSYQTPWWKGYNDFWWKKSTLYAKVEPVPEPGTLGFIGIGLLGLAMSRRLRKA